MSAVESQGRHVDLTGLPIASPIGFMAALGLLRVCAADHGAPVRLSWNVNHARLHGLDAAELVALLEEHMRGRSRAPEFNFEVASDKGKRVPVEHLRLITPDDFRAVAAALGDDSRALGFLAGFGTDAVITDKWFIGRTRFDFTSGQQRLVGEFRRLGSMLDPDATRPRVGLPDRIGRALFGGPYEEQSSLGWDPATLMAHAHQPIAPTDSRTPGQPMLIWLAIEGLPLHPVVPAAPGRAYTTGFDRGTRYVWPQWEAPLSLNEVTLLRHRPIDSLARLPGVTAVWASTVTSVGKYGVFRPAART
jgi:hypothetical protein